MASNQCDNIRGFAEFQAPRLKEAVKEDKWLLSERAHMDVGIVVALQDFSDNFLKYCAECWREEYCGEICPSRHNCDIGRRYMRD